jgi:hypothetical protein
VENLQPPDNQAVISINQEHSWNLIHNSDSSLDSLINQAILLWSSIFKRGATMTASTEKPPETQGEPAASAGRLWSASAGRLWSPGEIARHFGVGVHRVNYAIDSRGIRPVQKVDRIRVFASDQLPTFADALGIRLPEQSADHQTPPSSGGAPGSGADPESGAA